MLKHKVIAECEGECFSNLSNTSDADIILMDIEMPRMSDIDMLTKHFGENWDIKAIAVTSYEEKLYLAELINIGFKGCVLKRNIYSQLTPAIEKVMNDEIYFPVDIKI
jgi:DNA-binding NarL/FixJ family response regulator